jgi:predicted site-specific integrase-resolvase
MSTIDPIDDLEQQVQKLQQIQVNEDNHENVLKDVESLLSSIDEKLETALKLLTKD